MRSDILQRSRRAAAVLLGRGAGLVATLDSASAQPPTKVPRIGIVTAAPCSEDNHVWGFFLQGLRTRGYAPGQSILLDCRFSDKLDMPQFQRFASELVRLNVDVIFAISSTATRAVRQVTRMPVVVTSSSTGRPPPRSASRSLSRSCSAPIS